MTTNGTTLRPLGTTKRFPCILMEILVRKKALTYLVVHVAKYHMLNSSLHPPDASSQPYQRGYVEGSKCDDCLNGFQIGGFALPELRDQFVSGIIDEVIN